MALLTCPRCGSWNVDMLGFWIRCLDCGHQFPWEPKP